MVLKATRTAEQCPERTHGEPNKVPPNNNDSRIDVKALHIMTTKNDPHPRWRIGYGSWWTGPDSHWTLTFASQGGRCVNVGRHVSEQSTRVFLGPGARYPHSHAWRQSVVRGGSPSLPLAAGRPDEASHHSEDRPPSRTWPSTRSVTNPPSSRSPSQACPGPSAGHQ